MVGLMNHDASRAAEPFDSADQHVVQPTAEPAVTSLSLRALIAQSAEALLIVDLHGHVRFVNPAAELIFGRSRDDLLGSPLGLPLATGAPSDIEIIRPNGGVAIVELRVEPLRWQDEDVLLARFHDVTQRKRSEQLLIESQQFLRSTLDALAAQIAILDQTGTIIAVNAAWQNSARDAGYDPYRSGVGHNYLSVCDAVTGADAALAQQSAQLIRQVLHNERSTAYLEYPCALDTGTLWYAMRVTRFGEGSAARIVVAHEEITERKVAEQLDAGRRRVLELIARHHGLEAVCQELLAMVQRQYSDGRYVSLNLRTHHYQAHTTSLDPAGIEALGQQLSRYLVPTPGAPPVTQIVPLTAPDWQDLRPIIEPSGIQRFWVAHIHTNHGGVLGSLVIGRRYVHRLTPMDLAFIELIVQLCSIAIEQHERTFQLAYQAHHDRLTGLPNRQLFEERLGHAIENARRSGHQVAVLFIDLDRFKQINDTLGHATGDALLVQLARRFEGALRSTDTLARHGGDEFMVVLPEIEATQQVLQIAQRLHDLLDLPFVIDGNELYVTASIGASLYPHDGLDSSSLQRNADAAMYRAKAHVRNSFQLFDSSANAAAFERLRLENLLRRAIERDELRVYYQPKMDRQQQIIGLEALLRWQSAELGMVPPNQFIPIAEDLGLIVDIGAWCLREVCRQALAWQQEGFAPITIAVNVSAIQFAQANFITDVAQILASSVIDPKLLELELTETMLMGDHEAIQRQLTQLSNLHVSLAIDDFGKGYSSLGYLHRLPIHVLKIDRLFIEPLGTAHEEPRTQAILSAIITLGHHLNMTILAEGVETQAQFERLSAMGCDLFQGYLFSKPLPPDDVRVWLPLADAG